MDILIRGMEMPKDIEPGLVIEFADSIDGKRYAKLYHYRHGGLTEWLEAVSAADVRPVVTCADCKHFQVNVSPSGYLPQGVSEWECRYWCRPTDPTNFCSYGEKKEEG